MNKGFSITKEELIKVFSVGFPEGFILYRSYDGCNQHEQYKNKEWTEITVQIIDVDFEVVIDFSNTACHYFLPAFILYSFEGMITNDTSLDYYLSTLERRIKSENDFLGLFSESQRALTIKWLYWLIDVPDIGNDESMCRDIEDMLEVLENGDE